VKTEKNICVYCGSNPGNDPAYLKAATVMGEAIARRGFGLVYGGANVGLMGAVADAALAAGGEVFGVLPRALQEKELAHKGLTRLELTDSMHQRKTRMAELSCGFVTLPGGAGTLEEVAEMWTWAQLGFHEKPVGFLNVAGYYDHLRAFVDHSVREGFVRGPHAEMLTFAADPDALLDAFEAYAAPVVVKWVEKAEL
jgi:uncharacterized protein (TIGR00730 family)